jgi:DNA polymerase-3 subunit epsilon
LHGALLDSQILGDVYLSMTGGQSDLDFTVSSTEQEIKENGSSDQLNSELNLKVIELTDEEKKSHKEYLLRMKEETGKDPLGLN